MADQAAMAAAFSLARRARFVYVSTNGPSGFPETRVMYNLLKHRSRAIAKGPAALARGFGSWLGTNTSSAKNKQLRKDPRACLYFADTKTFEGLSVTGRLEEVQDDAIRGAVYTRSWDVYYAGGKDGGDFTLYRFVPQTGRYYHGLHVSEFDASRGIPA